MMDMLKGVKDLKAGLQSTVPDFFGFDTWKEVVEFAQSADGQHLLTFVNLVESRGEKQLIWAINRSVDEEKGDVVISTVHRAKGREWRSVRLMDDFFKSRKKLDGSARSEETVDGFDPSELRLFYVALTRAKIALEVPEEMMSALRI
jgi:superfamily I DNA/RNA helicase